MDDSLMDKPRITFQAGTHREAVTIAMQDYLHLADPTVAHITYG
jgi:prolyl-tRNA editing enzyme YbaK/EbsC (Cys-tRNA(Pro) deacylase)